MIEGYRRRLGLMQGEAPVDYLDPQAMNLTQAWPTGGRVDSGLNPQMTRPVKSSFLNPADYAHEPQSAMGKAIDDYRAGKRDDTPAMLGSAAANIGMMPLRMMTLEGMAGLAKDAGRIAQIPYNVLTSPEPVSTAQMVQPAADMAMMAPLGGVAAGKMAPAGKAAYSNSKEGAVPGLLRSASAGEQMQQPGITAYHGSPHDFDRFSMDKIGTGEGAQAYGHGLYFAEREGVAKSYKEALGGTRLKDGTPFDETNPHHLAANALADADGNRATAIAGLKGSMQAVSAVHEGGYRQRLQRAIGVLERGDTVPEMDLGHMYEVRINADPSDFLDWDKPLSQQSEKVREAWNAYAKSPEAAKKAEDYYSHKPGMTLADLPEFSDPYGSTLLRNTPGKTEAEATAYLRDRGIPGIRYLDQGSRTAGEGSRNFVVFDDKLVSIVKKYGWAGAAAMLGISVDALQSQAEAKSQPAKPDPYREALRMKARAKALGLTP